MPHRTRKEVMRDVGKVMRRKITIEKLVSMVDDMGVVTEGWLEWKRLWAEVNGLWGQEYYAARAVNEENTLEFTIRDFRGLDSLNTVEYRISFLGKHFDIKHIDPIKFEGVWVKIRALERGINGQNHR